MDDLVSLIYEALSNPTYEGAHLFILDYMMTSDYEVSDLGVINGQLKFIS